MTEILERYGSKTREDIDGKKHSRKQILARMVWQMLTDGHVTLPNSEVLDVAPNDWIEAAKWLYRHIDGPPPAAVDITSQGEKISVDDERFDRAISTLADAIREAVYDQGPGAQGAVDPAEQAAMDGAAVEGG